MKSGQNIRYKKPFFNDQVNTNTKTQKYFDRFFSKDKNKESRNVVRSSKKK